MSGETAYHSGDHGWQAHDGLAEHNHITAWHTGHPRRFVRWRNDTGKTWDEPEPRDGPAIALEQVSPPDTDLLRQQAETAIRAAGGEGNIQMWNLAVRIPAAKVNEVHAVVEAMDAVEVYRSWMISYPPPMLVTLPEELLADLRDVLGKQVESELSEEEAVVAAVRDWIHAARFSGRPYWCEQHGWQSNYMPCPRRRHR